ncbi:transposase [Salisediminibacterium selenitireducens]|uniref:transposase n=1 Tax=Salisediminibacterium selenitireducens TaxID=85683 RepID=UPI0009FF65BA|nr:transposase [Salisediminibacterium selenitireducens]
MGDCVYGKHAQLDDYERQDQRFVIRFRENVKCHRPQGLQCFIPTHSNVTDDITCQLGTEQSRTTHRFRVVTFNDHKGHPIRVATNIRDLSAEAIASVYQTRWQIESFFQWI